MNHFTIQLSTLRTTRARVFTALAALALAIPGHAQDGDPISEGVRAFDQKQYSRAYEVLSGPASKGNRIAQRLCGEMHELGQGTTKDLKKAARFYTLSAEQDDTKAVEKLGRLFLRGKGLEQDEQKAVTAFRRGAMQGDGDCMFNLGYCLGTGRGTQKDLVSAFAWYDCANTFGVEAAGENREVVRAELDLQQESRGEQLSAEWHEKLQGGGFLQNEIPAVPLADWIAKERREAEKTRKKQIDPFAEDETEDTNEDVVEEESVFDLEDTTDDSNGPATSTDLYVGKFTGLMVETNEQGQTQEFPLVLTHGRDDGRLIVDLVSDIQIPGPNGQPIAARITGRFESSKTTVEAKQVELRSTAMKLTVPSLGHEETLPQQVLRLSPAPNGLKAEMGTASEGFTACELRRVGGDDRREEPARPGTGTWQGQVREEMPDGSTLSYAVKLQLQPGEGPNRALNMSGVVEVPTQPGQTIHLELSVDFAGTFGPTDVSLRSTRIDVRVRESGEKLPFQPMTMTGSIENGVLTARFGNDDSGYSALTARGVQDPGR